VSDRLPHACALLPHVRGETKQQQPHCGRYDTRSAVSDPTARGSHTIAVQREGVEEATGSATGSDERHTHTLILSNLTSHSYVHPPPFFNTGRPKAGSKQVDV